MIYVGIDIAKASHCIGAIDEKGQTVLKPRPFSQTTDGFAVLHGVVAALGATDEVVIGLEATGHYWRLLFSDLLKLGYVVKVMNPVLTAASARTNLRGRKTDEDDALVIARVLRDGQFIPLAVPSAEQERLKDSTRQRCRLVGEVAGLKVQLLTCLDLVFPEFARQFAIPYSATALAILEMAPSARTVAAMPIDRLADVMLRGSKGHFRRDRACDFQAAAKASLAAQRDDLAIELAVQQLVARIRLVESQIAVWDALIEKAISTIPNHLTSIPGIAAVTAGIILAEIGDFSRFCSAHGFKRLLAFAGLDPTTRSSGTWTGQVKMSKRGSRTLRAAIWRAAMVAWRHPDFRSTYDRHRVTKGRHFNIAISHVARKLLQAIYGVLKHQCPYDSAAFANGVGRAAA